MKIAKIHENIFANTGPDDDNHIKITLYKLLNFPPFLETDNTNTDNNFTFNTVSMEIINSKTKSKARQTESHL